MVAVHTPIHPHPLQWRGSEKKKRRKAVDRCSRSVRAQIVNAMSPIRGRVRGMWGVVCILRLRVHDKKGIALKKGCVLYIKACKIFQNY